MAVGVGAVALIVILFVGFDWVHGTVSPPALPIRSDEAKLVIENYKALNDVAHDGPTKLFDMMIVKVLFPLFTSIVGYIFGSQSRLSNAE